VIESAMFDILFDLPDQEAGKKYVLTPEVVRGQARLFPRDDSAAA
jgi:ATP-dependent Clp protease ATP-binding subunit ClpX